MFGRGPKGRFQPWRQSRARLSRGLEGCPVPFSDFHPPPQRRGLSSLGQLNQKRKTGHVWAVISSIQEQEMREFTATPKQDLILLTDFC